MTRELLIPGSPSPSEREVKIFQANNACQVDGKIGPETMGACWRKAGSSSYTVLAPYLVGGRAARRMGERAEVGRDHAGEAWALDYIRRHGYRVDLSMDAWRIIMEVLSSEWSTGLTFLSTQDGLTMGFRRYAAGTLARLLARHGVSASLPAKNNAIQDTRRQMLDLAASSSWWGTQLDEFLTGVQGRLRTHSFRSAKAILLYERMNNSAPSWVRGCHSYSDLVDSYSRHPRGESRIKRIERALRAEYGDTWREVTWR